MNQQNVKYALQLLLDEGAVEEKKEIKMVDCEGNSWSYDKEDARTLKLVVTEDGLDLLQIPNVSLHRFEGEMVIAIQEDKTELIMFFLEDADEYSKKIE